MNENNNKNIQVMTLKRENTFVACCSIGRFWPLRLDSCCTSMMVFEFLIVSHFLIVFSLFLILSHCFSLFLIVSHCFSLLLIASHCFLINFLPQSQIRSFFPKIQNTENRKTGISGISGIFRLTNNLDTPPVSTR